MNVIQKIAAILRAIAKFLAGLNFLTRRKKHEEKENETENTQKQEETNNETNDEHND